MFSVATGWAVQGLKSGCGQGIFSKTTQTGLGPHTPLPGTGLPSREKVAKA